MKPGKLTIFIALLLCSSLLSGYSTSIKASKDYKFTLDIMRKLSIIMKNFPNEENKKTYEKVQTLFRDASEKYYSREFTKSYQQYKMLKKQLIILLESLSYEYLKRSKRILDSVSKESFDILINFSKQSSFARYFRKPYDPLKDVKPYNKKYTAKDYHFFKDKTLIEAYIKNGYKKYKKSKLLFEDKEIARLKQLKKISDYNINHIINNYLISIQLCREAKQLGLEIFKLKNIHQLGDIMKKYNLPGNKITPIFDDRIPEKFKVDAVDNQNLVLEIEKERKKKILDLQKQ